MKAEIEDTYAEAFDGLYSRVIVTAGHIEVLCKAAQQATATPAIVIGRTEGGIEKYLNKQETPDKREGVILQFWGGIDENKPLESSLKKFEAELSFRLRQDILVKPFTAVFDALPKSEGKIGMMERVGHCGDGYEWTEERYGRELIVVPLMVSNFLIENELGYARGVMGANFWFMCKTKRAVMEAGKKALDAIHQVEGVVTPFDVCSAGSKPETRFPLIGPTTNHPYCHSLKTKLGRSSKVPLGVKYIPEIVINGTSMKAVKQAMKVGIQTASAVDGVVRVSAGNYGGKLGKHKIGLRGLF
ncbi:MAG: formylmethanofuran--tetrahydromethanopterin N-formyltransferase [Candidatus Bathyarchaeota archaeon]|nr:formylmethanofuran--tetrahydromethanopterin N-formyltransferase [Candidatus Bathyarchaeum sp.]